MSSSAADLPDLMPVLSRGRHRNPRKGACFMELASYLAGERWSDHPSCTHPLLGELARFVNDYTSDENRSRLAPLIPSVIGLATDDVRMDAVIALRCARTALPVVAAGRQRALAVSVITATRVLTRLDGAPGGLLDAESSDALRQTPEATRWACRFVGTGTTSLKGFRRHAAPNTVRCAVQGIADACIPQPEDVLRDLLADTIQDCASLLGRPGVSEVPDARALEAAGRLTRRK